MRHLAQVQVNPISGHRQLLLLAKEDADGRWLVGDRREIPFDQESCAAGNLLLVKFDDQGKVTSLQNATDWLLDIIKHYFEKNTITPEFVQKEQEKIENWRQEITAQSQDLTRRQLEIETRREQLEELEKKLAN